MKHIALYAEKTVYKNRADPEIALIDLVYSGLEYDQLPQFHFYC